MKKKTVSRKVINLIVTLMLSAGSLVYFSNTHVAAVTAASQADGTTGTWLYTLSEGSAANVYCTTTTLTGAVTVPSALDGYPVVSVGGGNTNTGVFLASRMGVTSVVLPDGVTGIGDSAFTNLPALMSVSIPDSVTSIGGSAFLNCDALTSITIPQNVTSIGTTVFQSCEALAAINIDPANTVYSSIGGVVYNKAQTQLFFAPPGLPGPYSVPGSVTSIADRAFRDCVSLTSISIPDSVRTIGNSAFEDCDALTSVAIPNGVTAIGTQTFYSCGSLISVTIPNSVTYIGTDAFIHCRSLASITLPNGVTIIGSGAFSYCRSISSITIPNGVTNISDSTFRGCDSLASVTIPNGVTSIGSNAFLNCTSLSSITIPRSIATIGAGAFLNSGLTNSTIVPVSGYTVQYNTVADGSGTVVTDLKAAAALTYLIWTPNTYTVTFNPEDGAVSPATKNVTYDSVYGTLPTAVRAGFTFGGWWTGDDGTGTQVRDTTAVRITADQTLYAKWTINPHTVTFDSHGGYGVEDVTVSHNQPLGASFPAAPVLAGHRFDGWYLDTGGTGAEFTANTPVTADITVYAKWTAKTPVSINEAAQTATFDGTAKAFTVSGMPGGEYNISYKRGEDSVIPVNAGSYDVVITRGEDDTYAAYSRTIANGLVITPPTISLQEIRGVTPPATGALPVAAITETMQFTGTVSWSPSDSRFAGSRAYTATVRLTPTGNYTLTGVGENFFAVVGATSVTNPAGSGVIAAAFPATAAEPSGGGDTVPVTKYSASVNTVSGSGATLPVTVNKDTRTASVDAGTQNLASGETAVTVPSIPDIDAYSVGIPVPELSTASKQGTLTFKTDTGSVTVPSNMLTGVSGSKAVISIGKGNKDSLPYNVKAAIGDKPLIRLTLSIDRKQTNWNNPDARVIISIPYTPTAEELLHPESIVVWYIDGSGNVVTIPNGHYDPATGMVTFNITHFSDYAVAYNQVSFNDVVTGAWYTKAVSFIAAREITSGTGDGNYSPNARLTRGEFIVLMMRAYGIVPNTNPANNFSDAGNTYYTGYLAAAKWLGITAGAGNNMYAPGKEITRQEMFTLLYNTLKVIGHLPQGDSGKSLSAFNDAGQIDTWAKDAMMVLVETGTVGGSAGRLTPTGTTTRAEMAQVLYNLLEK